MNKKALFEEEPRGVEQNQQADNTFSDTANINEEHLYNFELGGQNGNPMIFQEEFDEKLDGYSGAEGIKNIDEKYGSNSSASEQSPYQLQARFQAESFIKNFHLNIQKKFKRESKSLSKERNFRKEYIFLNKTRLQTYEYIFDAIGKTNINDFIVSSMYWQIMDKSKFKKFLKNDDGGFDLIMTRQIFKMFLKDENLIRKYILSSGQYKKFLPHCEKEIVAIAMITARKLLGVKSEL